MPEWLDQVHISCFHCSHYILCNNLGFQFSANSPQVTAIVVFAQFISNSANSRIILQAVINENNSAFLYIAKTLPTLFGIWNLEKIFFRTVLPPICLKVNTLQGFALDYSIAFYPLLLIVFTCILFKTYDRRYKLIIFI